MRHDFEKKKDGETEYSQCKKCHNVMFENDPYFNLVCFAAMKKRESQRKRLEKK